jgi:hypothetical protein
MLSGCSRENALPSATLSFRYTNASQDIEWADVSGLRIKTSGDCLLSAAGYNGELFKLQVKNVTQPGFINNLNASDITFEEGTGFKSTGIQSLQFVVDKVNVDLVTAHFYVVFTDKHSALVKAQGIFTIYGLQ